MHGNAVDAAIGAAICLGVVSPGSSGLGGGSFMLLYNASNKSSVFFDGRETAPRAAHKDMYANDSSLAYIGALSIAIPGQISALYKAWQMHGKAEWYEIVMKSYNLAKNFEVSSTLASHIEKEATTLQTDKRFAFLKTYLRGRYGRFVRTGDFLQNHALANTINMIAAYGDTYLTKEDGAYLLSKDLTSAGSIIASDELSDYEAVVRDSVVSSAMGYKYYGAPPPSSGK
jgi:gamma-glutamyltranspeptidase/glutathione hydrolase/leukotriene-C4 hydrolase